MTAALPARCARTGGTYGTGPCLARADGCPYCQLAAPRQTARPAPPTHERSQDMMPTTERPARDRWMAAAAEAELVARRWGTGYWTGRTS